MTERLKPSEEVRKELIDDILSIAEALRTASDLANNVIENAVTNEDNKKVLHLFLSKCVHGVAKDWQQLDAKGIKKAISAIHTEDRLRIDNALLAISKTLAELQPIIAKLKKALIN